MFLILLSSSYILRNFNMTHYKRPLDRIKILVSNRNCSISLPYAIYRNTIPSNQAIISCINNLEKQKGKIGFMYCKFTLEVKNGIIIIICNNISFEYNFILVKFRNIFKKYILFGDVILLRIRLIWLSQSDFNLRINLFSFY